MDLTQELYWKDLIWIWFTRGWILRAIWFVSKKNFLTLINNTLNNPCKSKTKSTLLNTFLRQFQEQPLVSLYTSATVQSSILWVWKVPFTHTSNTTRQLFLSSSKAMLLLNVMNVVFCEILKGVYFQVPIVFVFIFVFCFFSFLNRYKVELIWFFNNFINGTINGNIKLNKKPLRFSFEHFIF